MRDLVALWKWACLLATLACVGCEPAEAAPVSLGDASALFLGDASTGGGAKMTAVPSSGDDGARASVMAAYLAAVQSEGKEDPRYYLARSGGVLTGHNVAQGFDVALDRAGFELSHQQGGWRARVETKAIRCGDARSEVSLVSAREVQGEPHRASITRSAGNAAFEEWAINGPVGLEQGFTLPQDPCGGRASELVIEVGVGGMTPEVKGRGIALRDDAGDTRATVSELYAHDAAGTPLEGSLAAGSGTIEIRVNIADAEWPVVVDPIIATEVAKLSLDDGAASDGFGLSVALDGTTAVVGAFNNASGSTRGGAAYVFIRSGATWQFQAKLLASDGYESNAFGSSVAVSGTTAIVGAIYGAIGGSAYVFSRSGGSWAQQAKLIASDAVSYDRFGCSVAVSGTTALVGAEEKALGANASQGAAYVFVQSGASWTQQAKLVATDGAAGSRLGYSVALSGTTALAGATGADVVSNVRQGAAYVFVQSGTSWTQQAKLAASDGAAGDGLGVSVAVSGTTALVGAKDKQVGANTHQGAAYVFAQSGASWTEQAKLVASDGGANDSFGYSVALGPATALVGAAGAKIGSNAAQGAAYVFARSGATWPQQAKLVASNGTASDIFGRSVAVSGTTALVGSAADIGGNVFQGAGYLFAQSGPTWTQQAEVTASDGATSDSYGYSLAVDGTTALVGAPRADVDGNSNQGAAYVFVKTAASWRLQSKFTASDGAKNDQFGSSATLQGTTVVVGAPQKSIGGNLEQGAAYVFVRSGASWTQQARIVAGDGAAGDKFGASVALNETMALVGAYNKTAGSNTSQGAAYMFLQFGDTWMEQAKLVASDGAIYDSFGYSVAFSGETALVGAPGKKVGFSPQRGAAYVFSQSGTSWTQQAKLLATDGAPNDYFGTSAALEGRTALLGAWGAKFGGNVAQGAAYVFVQSGAGWTQQAKLVASDGLANDELGRSVALSQTTALAGAPNAIIEGSTSRGAAHVFVQSGTNWTHHAKLIATDGAAADRFGSSVALSGTTALVGAPYNDASGGDSGIAYVFALTGVAGTPCLGYAFCATSYACTNGVCCTSACSDPCEVCSLAAGAVSDGTCTPLPQGSAPASPCAGNLVCNGLEGFCPAACEADVECAAGNFCTSAGTCQPSRQNGAPCDPSGDCKDSDTCALCANGNCVDGVCCNSPCSGVCDRCDLYGSKGSCSPVPLSTATPCGTGYLCSGAAASCPSSCSSDTGCGSGFFCKSGACMPLLAAGGVCAQTANCQSGLTCVGGYCCGATSCGPCQTCQTGQCGPDLSLNGLPDANHGCAQDSPATCGYSGLCQAGQCALHSAGTTCNQSYCDDNVRKDRECDGTGKCISTSGSSCGAYQCQPGGLCPSACTGNNQCAAGYWCNTATQQCVSKLANGASCNDTSQCESSFCADGVCCNQACTGICRACSADKKDDGSIDGDCGAIRMATDPDNECELDPNNICGSDGLCDGTGACRMKQQGFACGETQCMSNSVTGNICNGSGQCTLDASGTSCAPYLCQGTACGTSCVGDAQCVNGAFCSTTGQCVSKREKGDVCSLDNECSSGHCVDSVCCLTECKGTCQACSAVSKAPNTDGSPSIDGECGAAKVGTDPHDECTTDPASPCGRDGMCDGYGACRLYSAGKACGATHCVGNHVAGQVCDGMGNCATDSEGVSCDPYICASDVCSSGCSSNAQCSVGSYCTAEGTCAPVAPQGSPCTVNDGCATGLCIDGYCCGGACSGQCEACDLAGLEGSCSAVVGAPHGTRATCAGTGTACEGTCAGSERAACAYPGAAVACGGVCADSSAVSSACSGDGKCIAIGAKDCAPFACADEQRCATECAHDVQCIHGYACEGGKCIPGQGGSCDGEHTVTGPGGIQSDCSPYRCTPDGKCGTSCSSDDGCTAAFVCNAQTSQCSVPAMAGAGAPVVAEDSSACGCRVPGRTRSPTWPGLALAGLVALARVRRRRNGGRESLQATRVQGGREPGCIR